MFSKLLTRGFSFQFYFLLWEFNNAFSHFWEFFCSRHVNQDVVGKNCLYCSLEKYYFQSLLNGVFINKKRQPSDFRMLDKTEKGPVYYYWKVVYGRNDFCCTCELSNLWSVICDLWPKTRDLWPVTCELRPVTCDLRIRPAVEKRDKVYGCDWEEMSVMSNRRVWNSSH